MLADLIDGGSVYLESFHLGIRHQKISQQRRSRKSINHAMCNLTFSQRYDWRIGLQVEQAVVGGSEVLDEGRGRE